MDNNIIIFVIIVASLIIITKVVKSLNTLKPEKANELVKNGALIVDVRQPSEFSGRHIKNAINIPLNNISKITSKANKDKTIILYCLSGARSSSAYRQLKTMGYKNVHDMGGINRWSNG